MRLSPVRGGLPLSSIIAALPSGSLPRARGVYRCAGGPTCNWSSLSPVRGGLPVLVYVSAITQSSLPRARGFTVVAILQHGAEGVSPPCAGVYRPGPTARTACARLSPVRGGLPPYGEALLSRC